MRSRSACLPADKPLDDPGQFIPSWGSLPGCARHGNTDGRTGPHAHPRCSRHHNPVPRAAPSRVMVLSSRWIMAATAACASLLLCSVRARAVG